MKTCPIQGKICYASRHEADRALARMQRRPGAARKGAATYECRCCGSWHTTGHKRDKQRIERRILAQWGIHA